MALCSASLASKVKFFDYLQLSSPINVLALRYCPHGSKSHYPVATVYYSDIISLGNADCFLNIGSIPGHF